MNRRIVVRRAYRTCVPSGRSGWGRVQPPLSVFPGPAGDKPGDPTKRPRVGGSSTTGKY